MNSIFADNYKTLFQMRHFDMKKMMHCKNPLQQLILI